MQVSARAPRKQSLGPLADISAQVCLLTLSCLLCVSQDSGGLKGAVPSGLTGDLFKDTELVEAKVGQPLT